MKEISKADKLFMKSYLKQKYPSYTHTFDIIFDYYIGLCSQFLGKRKNLGHQVLEIEKEDIQKIDKYIKDNNNEDGKDMLIFYLMTKTAILILHKYYNEDGSAKELD